VITHFAEVGRNYWNQDSLYEWIKAIANARDPWNREGHQGGQPDANLELLMPWPGDLMSRPGAGSPFEPSGRFSTRKAPSLACRFL
jgi:hypothetical protein